MTTLPDTTTEKGQREASVMLAQLAKLHNEVHYAGGGVEKEIVGFSRGYNCLVTLMYPESPNLYDPANMALAWRVLNWANEWMANGGARDFPDFCDDILRCLDAASPPAAAQRAWLDKILSLAIEAGMI